MIIVEIFFQNISNVIFTVLFRFALNKDDQTTFISAGGKLNLQAVQWSEPPQQIVHDPPFLIGIFLFDIVIISTLCENYFGINA